MSNNSIDKSLYVKISTGKKMAYGGIDLACCLSWSYIGSFLLVYMTDVLLIPIGVASFVMLFCRLWDAINDPIVGTLADRTTTKWGRYRPWVFICSAPLFICTALLFFPVTNFSDTGKIVYVMIMYSIVTLLYTCVNMSFGSLAGVMTQDPAERGSITSWRMALAWVGISVANLVISWYGASINESFPGYQYFIVSCIFGCIGIPMQIFGTKVQRELPELTPPYVKGAQKKGPGPVELFKMSVQNKPFMQVSVVNFLMGVGGYAVTAINVYWMTYVLGDMAFFGTISLVTLVPSVIGAYVFQYIANYFKDKASAVKIGYIISLVANLVGFIFMKDPASINKALLMVVSIFISFISGLVMAAILGLIPDTCEYGELQNKGVRADGFLYTICSFWNKLGITIGTSGAGWIIGWFGYVANAETQPDSAIWALNALKWGLPVVVAVLQLIVLSRYKLNYAEFDKIVKQIQDEKPGWTN